MALLYPAHLPFFPPAEIKTFPQRQNIIYNPLVLCYKLPKTFKKIKQQMHKIN